MFYSWLVSQADMDSACQQAIAEFYNSTTIGNNLTGVQVVGKVFDQLTRLSRYRKREVNRVDW